ncbi:MAG: 5-oxoprolinase [Desulfobacterales bacterium]|nr:5-oxoprolinase [Desulfobacterales bacterium]
MHSNKKFKFSVDRGGTFTDIYAEIPGGGFEVVKLLSEDPSNYMDAPREGIRRILSKYSGSELPKDSFSSESIEWIRMGTTVATNALLERKGADTVLLTTKGFKDILKIGNQDRPDIFDLEIKKPELLYKQVIEVDEEVCLANFYGDISKYKTATGTTGEKIIVVKEPDKESIRRDLEGVFEKGIRSVAVVFKHGYTYARHEKIAGVIAKEIGFTQISLSHEVMPMIKMVGRGDTTTVDAYLTPHIRKYLSGFIEGFSDGLKGSSLLFMQSDGGLVDGSNFKGSNAILSGPAGGVVGFAETTYDKESNKPVIGFDMGGTSTDVSRFGGEYELVHETETAGVRIKAPQMQIKTVAAGGGSRLFFKNNMFYAGPESAGAHPGPICYRKNGYLTVTDANLFLGRVQVDYFPKIFGDTEDQPLDYEAVKKAFEEITESINSNYKDKGLPQKSCEEIAEGFLEVANEVMIRPIREISVMRGYNIKEHILACFGGAGGQHACAIARALGIKEIFIHRFSGILSAYGMGLADIVCEKQEPSAIVLDQSSKNEVESKIKTLTNKAVDELITDGYAKESFDIRKYLNLRYDGTDTSFMIDISKENNYTRKLEEIYIREFGFELKGKDVIVDDIRVRINSKSEKLVKIKINRSSTDPKAHSVKKCYFDGKWHKTNVFLMEELGSGDVIEGPSIVMQNSSTIIIEPFCIAKITEYGDIKVEVGSKDKATQSKSVDPVQLSIFSNLFMSIAEQMGRALQKTSISTNIKERLDFSCAIFDERGDLVANAPHVPVHLGAMGEAVKKQVEVNGDNIKKGDVLVTNSPSFGGSHLPDITVITPVFRGERIVFFVGSRGHHADIGGISPGSMPPFSRTLDDEGAVIESFKLVENNIFNEDGISQILLSKGARRLSDNISDLKAQVAANQKGIELLNEMVDYYSIDMVKAYMQYIQDNAETAVKTMLHKLSIDQGLKAVDSVIAKDHLDDGSLIYLKLTIDRVKKEAIFDFTGTGKELWGNLNAPVAVTYSAILYSLRSLINQDIPLNQGCMKPIKVIIPKGSLLSPSGKAAVVGGNVLTSQRITDVILKAFKAAAGSQGCMNNFTFGNEKFGYYETIGGGAGAGPSWHGQSGVHTHMTNTRITDPEILEKRFPVVLKQFKLREGSFGKGKFNGGDGLIREVEFLENLNVAILSERRVFPPYGLNGGEPGACGENIFRFKDGREISLSGKNEITASKGDSIKILTPGGGGYEKD